MQTAHDTRKSRDRCSVVDDVICERQSLLASCLCIDNSFGQGMIDAGPLNEAVDLHSVRYVGDQYAVHPRVVVLAFREQRNRQQAKRRAASLYLIDQDSVNSRMENFLKLSTSTRIFKHEFAHPSPIKRTGRIQN